MRDYSRKPYIAKKDGSYKEMMKSVTDKSMFNQDDEGHSEFKKPYKSKDYSAMEHFYPVWGNYNWPGDFSGPAPTLETNTEWFMGGDDKRCILACYAPLHCDDDVRCHFGVVTGDWVQYGEFKAYARNRLVGDTRWKKCDIDLQSGVHPIVIKPPSGEWIPWPDAKYEVKLTFFDKETHELLCATTLYPIVCYDTCCKELPEGVFAFDGASTADTIVAGDSMELYATGGCLPLTFATSSAGYTIEGSASYKTSNRNATLFCAAGT